MDKIFSVNNAKFLIQVVLIIVAMTMAWGKMNTDVELMKKDITREVALIQKDINIINTNHLSHMQDDINELKTNYKDQTKILNEMMILIKSTHR